MGLADAPPEHALERLRGDLDLAAEHALDQRVERDDLAAQQRTGALAGVALQRVALERRGHEQQRPRARLAGRGEAVEQNAELARAHRPDDELERHRAVTRLDEEGAQSAVSCGGGLSSICFATAALTASMPSEYR